MNICKHFKPFPYTTNDHPYNIGKCERVENYLANGGSVEKTEDIIRNKLNGALEIVNVSQAVGRLDDDEKGICEIDTIGGKQSVLMVNESGLYSLIFTSNKPEAKAFRKWVTSEVLPSIRKKGGYSPVTTDQRLDRLENELAILKITSKPRITRVASIDSEVSKAILNAFDWCGPSHKWVNRSKHEHF